MNPWTIIGWFVVGWVALFVVFWSLVVVGLCFGEMKLRCRRKKLMKEFDRVVHHA